MAKKTRKHSRRKSRRRTRHRKLRGGSDRLPLVPPNSAFDHSTAGESSDNVMGYAAGKK